MSIGLKAMFAAAAAATSLGAAGMAQAQPEYGYGQLPPAPYQETGGGGSVGCSRENFTLLGAHAGVTVLGLDLGASAHLGVPTDEGCGQGGGGYGYAPRPYAPPEQPMGYGPPPPYAYAQPAYPQPPAYQPYAQLMYQQPQPQPPMWGYDGPCGCAASSGW